MNDTIEQPSVPTCSFCGTPKAAQTPLIAGNEGHICEQCVKLAFQVISSWGRKKTAAKPEVKTPEAIKAVLDDYIIGQDEAKKTLAVAVFNHYLRLINVDEEHSLPLPNNGKQVEVEKSNVLMAGPSGTGKTLLVKSLARIIGVPFVIGDATTLTQAGYVGQDVESLLKRLLEAAEGDLQLAQWGIVYIDEIDKIARRGEGGAAVRDVSGEGVQQALLKMVEGSEVRLPKPGQRDAHGEEVVLNTQNILFIAGGAFPGLVELVEHRMQPVKTGIGFNAVVEHENSFSNDELLAALQPSDLQRFGLIPEFIGRFPVITFLQELDVASLKRILVEPRNALTKQFAQIFAYQGAELVFKDEALTFMAEEAVARGTGARGLRSVLELLLRETMFTLPSLPNPGRYAVEVNTVDSAEESSSGEDCEPLQQLVVNRVGDVAWESLQDAKSGASAETVLSGQASELADSACG
ncbi:MAG: ATP-dependent Clp protease ATP-binding subunit ClpX [Gammaproteobacteria bacterium]|nr:MAG: ATP-dependent Clp protease ATP-binding subunit ClpX [Gammaproteobacteria bacterium]